MTSESESNGYRTSWDIILNLLLSIISVLVALTLPKGDVLRVFLALPLLLFTPGYALVSLIWPMRYVPAEADGPASGILSIERLALGFGLTIVILAMSGMALNYAWEISLTPILTVLLTLIFAFSIGAMIRRFQLPENVRFTPDPPIKNTFSGMSSTDKMFAAVIGIGLLSSTLAIGYVITNPPAEEPFSEFYLLDQNRTVLQLPKNITANQTQTVLVGIVCQEYQNTDYTVEINLLSLGDVPSNVTLESYTLSLQHEASDERPFDFSISQPGDYRLEFDLYLNSETESSMKTTLNIHVDGQ